MNSAAIWMFVVLTIAIFISVSSQSFYQNSPSCYGSSCPGGTTRCKKHMKSSADGFMSIEVYCLDDDDGVLKTYYYNEPTSLNPHTKYESTSYSDIGGSSNTYNNGFNGFRKNNEANDLTYY